MKNYFNKNIYINDVKPFYYGEIVQSVGSKSEFIVVDFENYNWWDGNKPMALCLDKKDDMKKWFSYMELEREEL